jgi:hypothetical protein
VCETDIEKLGSGHKENQLNLLPGFVHLSQTCNSYVLTKTSGYLHESAHVCVWLLNRTVGSLVQFHAT